MDSPSYFTSEPPVEDFNQPEGLDELKEFSLNKSADEISVERERAISLLMPSDRKRFDACRELFSDLFTLQEVYDLLVEKGMGTSENAVWRFCDRLVKVGILIRFAGRGRSQLNIYIDKNYIGKVTEESLSEKRRRVYPARVRPNDEITKIRAEKVPVRDYLGEETQTSRFIKNGRVISLLEFIKLSAQEATKFRKEPGKFYRDPEVQWFADRGITRITEALFKLIYTAIEDSVIHGDTSVSWEIIESQGSGYSPLLGGRIRKLETERSLFAHSLDETIRRLENTIAELKSLRDLEALQSGKTLFRWVRSEYFNGGGTPKRALEFLKWAQDVFDRYRQNEEKVNEVGEDEDEDYGM